MVVVGVAFLWEGVVGGGFAVGWWVEGRRPVGDGEVRFRVRSPLHSVARFLDEWFVFGKF